MIQKIVEGHPTVRKKIKTHEAAEITLPHIPDAVVDVEDMLGKVLKLRYSNHEVRDMEKFPELAEEDYLVDTWEIGPLGRPIMEPAQWIPWLYNSNIMNLLNLPHFGRS
jgi:hypothetical protein